MAEIIPPHGCTQCRVLAILSEVREIDIRDLAGRIYGQCGYDEIEGVRLAMFRLRQRGYNIQKRPVLPPGFRHARGRGWNLYRLER